MSFFNTFFLFILGLFIGSFLNVLSDRLPKGETILGRSHCDSCRQALKWHDLFPVLSFVSLRGECRYCHKKLSYQYPLSELITGFIFAVVYLFMTAQNEISLANITYYLLVSSGLIVIFFSDLRHGIIPNKILVSLTLFSFIWLLVFHFSSLPYHLIAAILAFSFFLLIFLLTKGRGMGLGDVKMAGFIGFFMGISLVFSAFYIAFLTGGLWGFILILWKKKELKSSVPFGPFLVIGVFLAFIFQNQILSLISSYL